MPCVRVDSRCAYDFLWLIRDRRRIRAPIRKTHQVLDSLHAIAKEINGHVFTVQKVENHRQNSNFERSSRMRGLPLLPTIRAESPLAQRSVHNLHHLDDLLILPPPTNQLYPHR